jgi:CRISPR-associated protein Cas2
VVVCFLRFAYQFQERKDAGIFRKKLLKDGFTMMQYSVYVRHTPSRENANVHIKRVQKNLPPRGQVSILKTTDKQYGHIINYWGKAKDPLPTGPQQLEMF